MWLPRTMRTRARTSGSNAPGPSGSARTSRQLRYPAPSPGKESVPAARTVIVPSAASAAEAREAGPFHSPPLAWPRPPVPRADRCSFRGLPRWAAAGSESLLAAPAASPRSFATPTCFLPESGEPATQLCSGLPVAAPLTPPDRDAARPLQPPGTAHCPSANRTRCSCHGHLLSAVKHRRRYRSIHQLAVHAINTQSHVVITCAKVLPLERQRCGPGRVGVGHNFLIAQQKCSVLFRSHLWTAGHGVGDVGSGGARGSDRDCRRQPKRKLIG